MAKLDGFSLLNCTSMGTNRFFVACFGEVPILAVHLMVAATIYLLKIFLLKQIKKFLAVRATKLAVL